jgi:hypothetical protein
VQLCSVDMDWNVDAQVVTVVMKRPSAAASPSQYQILIAQSRPLISSSYMTHVALVPQRVRKILGKESGASQEEGQIWGWRIRQSGRPLQGAPGWIPRPHHPLPTAHTSEPDPCTVPTPLQPLCASSALAALHGFTTCSQNPWISHHQTFPGRNSLNSESGHRPSLAPYPHSPASRLSPLLALFNNPRFPNLSSGIPEQRCTFRCAGTAANKKTKPYIIQKA